MLGNNNLDQTATRPQPQITRVRLSDLAIRKPCLRQGHMEGQMETKDSDVTIENHGSLCLFRPSSLEATTWLEEHTGGTWFGFALVVEPRYAENLAKGLVLNGFSVEGMGIHE